MPASPDWFRRYLAGERAQVWHELRQAGSGVRDSGLLGEAEQVCDEMARRARHNVELLVGRLGERGYRFHSNDDEQRPVVPWVPPTAHADAHARWLEERFDVVPLTLLAWVRHVGDVWLVGTHPEWPTSAAADPLVIEVEGSRHPGSSMRGAVEEEVEVWQESRADGVDLDPFVLPLAPDRLHKDNVSGGPPYGVVLPDGCADALFVGAATTSFVAYLNAVFARGGFPWRSDTNSEGPITRDLAAGMLPL